MNTVRLCAGLLYASLSASTVKISMNLHKGSLSQIDTHWRKTIFGQQTDTHRSLLHASQAPTVRAEWPRDRLAGLSALRLRRYDSVWGLMPDLGPHCGRISFAVHNFPEEQASYCAICHLDSSSLPAETYLAIRVGTSFSEQLRLFR